MSFGTCCLTLHATVAVTCKARFRLSGLSLPGGSRTRWIATRGFSSCCRSSSPPALLTLPDIASLIRATAPIHSLHLLRQPERLQRLAVVLVVHVHDSAKPAESR